MIKDWNRGEVAFGDIFHFNNSLRPFLWINDTSSDDYFLDIHKMEFYSFDELSNEGLDFYRIEEDEEFLGVMIIAKMCF